MRLSVAKKVFIFLSVTFLGSLWLYGQFRHDETSQKYNLILVSVDALSARHMSLYGYDKNTTIFIDKFAKENTYFTQFFANSNITLPSHMSMMTGVAPNRHNLIDVKNENILSKKIHTLAEVMKYNGYNTFWFGPRDNARLALHLGFGRGIDKVVSGSRDKENLSEVFDHLEQSRQPFFAFLHVGVVHDPYIQDPPVSEYCDSLSPFTEVEKRQWKESRYKRYRKFANLYWDRFDLEKDEDVKKIVDAYNCSIIYVDQLFESLVAWLKEKGLYDNSILVFTSDHGEAFGQHGHFRHLTLHNENLHIPLIIKSPNLNSRVENRLGSHIDIVPTILGLLGISELNQVDGVNLFSLEAPLTEYVYSYWYHGRSIQSLKWKYIFGYHGEEELYDLTSDPLEAKNLIFSNESKAEAVYPQLKKLILDAN